MFGQESMPKMVVDNMMQILLVNLRKRVSEQLEDDFSPSQLEAIQKAIMRMATPEMGTNKLSNKNAQVAKTIKHKN